MHLGLRTESEAPYTSKSHTCGLLHPESFGPRVLQKLGCAKENRQSPSPQETPDITEV